MWDQRYGEPGFAYGTRPNDFLAEQAHQIPAGGRVCELAAGEGRNAVYLAELGYDVTAVDSSLVGLEKARTLACERGVAIRTVHRDLADFDLGSGQWDGIVSIFAHVPVPLRERLHAAIPAALNPGGCLVLEAYTPQHPLMLGRGGPPAERIDLFMSLPVLRKELMGLDFEIGQEVERSIEEGIYHQGHSAVVQVLGRKSA
jgi:SAM-dependent methyltransferase